MPREGPARRGQPPGYMEPQARGPFYKKFCWPLAIMGTPTRLRRRREGHHGPGMQIMKDKDAEAGPLGAKVWGSVGPIVAATNHLSHKRISEASTSAGSGRAKGGEKDMTRRAPFAPACLIGATQLARAQTKGGPVSLICLDHVRCVGRFPAAMGVERKGRGRFLGSILLSRRGTCPGTRPHKVT